ncbi:hypothetical protein Tco_1192876 [Tanacetum coccineum]
MAALKYRAEHNRIGFLEKPKGSTDYHQVIDFLLDSHIRYAIVTDPLIYDSLITQFWSTASLRSSELGPPAIVATIDGTPYTITESLVRSQLQLHDEGGIMDMPIPDIFLGMDNLGYPTEGKLTFHKNKFSPQWSWGKASEVLESKTQARGRNVILIKSDTKDEEDKEQITQATDFLQFPSIPTDAIVHRKMMFLLKGHLDRWRSDRLGAELQGNFMKRVTKAELPRVQEEIEEENGKRM